MSLFEEMQNDVSDILNNDGPLGFAIAITVMDPELEEPIETKGIFSDIHASTLDGDIEVSGRVASVTLPLDVFDPKRLPEKVDDAARMFWKVSARGQTYRVIEAMPDRSANNIVCYLGGFRD